MAANRKTPAVLILSGGSSGSHLLARQLARYRPMVAGPELNLAFHPDLFRDRRFKEALLRGIMRTEPIVDYMTLENGRRFYPVPPLIFTNADQYHVDTVAAKARLITRCGQWRDLLNEVMRILARHDLAKTNMVYIEHSPSSSVAAKVAGRRYPDLRLLHILRDPRDAVASMTGRRAALPHYAGVGRPELIRITALQWAILTECALQCRSLPSYRQIRYEALVSNPEAEIEGALAHCLPDLRHHRLWDTEPALNGTITPKPGWSATDLLDITDKPVGGYARRLQPDEIRYLLDLEFDLPIVRRRVKFGDYITRLGYGK